MTDKKIIILNPSPDGFGETKDKLDAADFASKLPSQHTHVYYSNDSLGLYVGVWDTTDMVEIGGPYECDEFMWLLEGKADIKNNKTGAIETVKAGEAFIIPKGYDCQWQQVGYLRKFFVISQHPNQSIPATPAFAGIIKPQVDAPMSVMDVTDPFVINGTKPVQKNCSYYEDTTGQFFSGTWDSEPFTSEIKAFPCNEFVYLLEGSITLIDEEGAEHFVKAGDAFFIPQGTVCGWRTTEYVRKFYAIQQSL